MQGVKALHLLFVDELDLGDRSFVAEVVSKNS